MQFTLNVLTCSLFLKC